MKNKVKIYCLSSLLLTFILTLLRCVSLTAFYDIGLGYFTPALVPTVMNVLFVLCTLWAVSALILIPKFKIQTEFIPNELSIKGTSLFAAVLFLFSAASLFGSNGNSLFIPICAIATLISALFFILSLFDSKICASIRAFTSIALIASLTIALAALYFDMTIAMNSPHKIHGSFAFMSAMIFALCETRTYLGNPLPRLHLASSLLTFMLGISFALSSVTFLITAAPSPFVTNPIVLGNIGYIGIIIGISAYATARSFTFNNTSEE